MRIVRKVDEARLRLAVRRLLDAGHDMGTISRIVLDTMDVWKLVRQPARRRLYEFVERVTKDEK